MAKTLNDVYGGGGSYEPRIITLEERVDNIKPSPAFEVRTADFTAAVDSAYLCDLRTVSAMTVTLPLTPAAGVSVSIGDYSGDCSVLKPIQIQSDDEPLEGIAPGGDPLFLTNGNVKLTFSYIDTDQGWKIVDGIGEGSNSEAPYEEVTILPVGFYEGTGYSLPMRNGVQLTWADFEYVEAGFNSSDSAEQYAYNKVGKEFISAHPTNWEMVGLRAGSTDYICEIRATGNSTFNVVDLNSNNMRVLWFKGYTKYKPVVSTAQVIETGRTATAWYRKWSDGFIEQGGLSNPAAIRGTITLPTAFTDTNYQVQVSVGSPDGSGLAFSVRLDGSKTNSEFEWQGTDGSSQNVVNWLSWAASGF